MNVLHRGIPVAHPVTQDDLGAFLDGTTSARFLISFLLAIGFNPTILKPGYFINRSVDKLVNTLVGRQIGK